MFSETHSGITSKQLQVTTVFKQEDRCPECGPNQVTYRIPALIYIHENQTYIAFAEKRKTPNDTDADVLVMRRGMWNDGQVEWDNNHAVVFSACLPNHRSMNPCPVYEKKSKILFLFFITVPVGVSEQAQIKENKNQARLCYVTSKDTGITWSHITDLTTDVISYKVKDWATFAVGPGHGIQTQSGRLIIPAYAYHCHPTHKPTPYAFALYSDDHGSSWHVGEHMSDESCECEMAEIIDHEGKHHLYCNARSRSSHRVEALSKSIGQVFDNPSSARKLSETGYGCQGSVLSFAPDKISENTWLMYCHPTNPHQRRSLGIYLNKTPWDASGWEELKMILHHGPSGYSDLAQCGDGGYFACLMECGERREDEEVGLVIFKLSDVIQAKHAE
ncbi:sialidase-3-like [Triplophysa dalaica]|uniref:sialidase-3-like n=1 Tax=Triplophysa dalaica TaxID=1582913 RepID=UPI0024DF539C|nr:sialidase-3-like [Triplophysa dalaica]